MSSRITVAFLNCRGQSGFNISKQLQIESFLQNNSIDILQLQECRIDDDTFNQCGFLTSNYNVLKNNSQNEYGTASIVKNHFIPEDIILHNSGRIIIFNIGDITFGNVYLPSGSDGNVRASRENFCGETIPTLLINSKLNGIIGGDWNNIISNIDCTRHPESKMSPCLKRLVSTFSWSDSYRSLYPNTKCFSHFYSNARTGDGATRIDRAYFFGDLKVSAAKYVSVAFTDHLSYIVTLQVPTPLESLLSPRSRHFFKTTPAIVKDKVFQARLFNSMEEWKEVKAFGVPVLAWWEGIVKPGIKKLAIERGKELNKERRGHLNLLMLRQCHLTNKVQAGLTHLVPTLREIQLKIEEWFEKEVEKVKHQSRVDDIQVSEKVRIYHHEIHKKNYKKSTILKLSTELGLLEGHTACASYLQNNLETLLLHPAELNKEAQDKLLNEVHEVFTKEDNKMLVAKPTKAEVEESVKTSNVDAAPGSDGITSLVYRECFNILGDALTEVAEEVFSGSKLTRSQRTSLMIFSNKPGKSQSIKPRDKRRISLLNSDFKILSGIELLRYNKVLTHTLSPQQLACGDNRRITFGISLARDAIQAVSKSKVGCGIADNDFEAAFDFLCLDWVKLVLKKKGLAEEALERFSNIYAEGITIPVINNIPGKPLQNIRLSLRQGDRPSGVWFCYGIDPLLSYLDKRLKGILVHSLPVQGPALQGQALQPVETRYKVQGYLDDCKPAITTMAEFLLVDFACKLFEQSSGCRLHRNPDTDKCKVLLLGRWKDVLQQEDIPLPYLKIADHLDYLGCKLYADFASTRRENGEIMKKKVRDQIGSWKSGKFLPLTSRPWSVNSYCLSKLWYKTSCLDLRVGDCNAITSNIKGWMYQDMLIKPQEMMLYRQTALGGLGLHNVKLRAMAMLIHTFLMQAISPRFTTNYYLNTLYRWHVLDHREMPDPGRPPYYSAEFFTIIKDIHNNTSLNVVWITVKQWYQILLERGLTHTSDDPDSPPILIKSHLEELSPDHDFSPSYRLARLFGLSPDLKSFMFKVLQNLLPTRERQHRCGRSPSPACTFCGDPQDTTLHLFSCPQSTQVTTPLLESLSDHIDNITPGSIVKLDIRAPESWDLPAVWLVATCLQFIWENRISGKVATRSACKAELTARLAILKETKWKHYNLHNGATLLEETLNLHW